MRISYMHIIDKLRSIYIFSYLTNVSHAYPYLVDHVAEKDSAHRLQKNWINSHV